jgi:hypothetical protein
MHESIVLAVRPSLADPARWSVDFWSAERPRAAYQASFFSYPSPQEAARAAQVLQAHFEGQGLTVSQTHFLYNASRDEVPAGNESEEDIKKHLEKGSSHPLQLDATKLLNPGEWPKLVKLSMVGHPRLLSVVVIAALALGGTFEEVFRSLALGGLETGWKGLLACSPLAIAAAALLSRVRGGLNQIQDVNQAETLRRWILELVVHHGWDRDRFMAEQRKVFEEGRISYPVRRLLAALEGAPETLTPHHERLPAAAAKRGQSVEELVRQLLKDDFGRKIQAFVGAYAERAYGRRWPVIPNPMALLTSTSTVKMVAELLTDGVDVFDEREIWQRLRRTKYGVANLRLLGAIWTFLLISFAMIWGIVYSVNHGPTIIVVANVLSYVATLYLLVYFPIHRVRRDWFLLPQHFGINEWLALSM